MKLTTYSNAFVHGTFYCYLLRILWNNTNKQRAYKENAILDEFLSLVFLRRLYHTLELDIHVATYQDGDGGVHLV